MQNKLVNTPLFKNNYQIIHGDCQKELRAFPNWEFGAQYERQNC
jgi:hypothetical protein